MLCIDFHMRMSPYLHPLIWTSDGPKLTHENREEYIDFIDTHFQGYLPDKKQTQSCLSWLQHIKTTVTQRLVQSTEMFHADFILAHFLLKGQ